MRKELEQIALIESYLGGTMSPEEKLHFEAAMTLDDNLKEEVNRQRDLVGALLVAAFASDAQNFRTELAAKSSRMLGKMIWYSLSGVVLVVGLTAMLLLWRSGTAPNTRMHELQAINSGKPNDVITVAKPSEQPQKAAPPLAKHQRRKLFRHRKETGLASASAVPFDLANRRSEANLQNFLPQSHLVKMNPNEDFTFKMAESNSAVHIPANSIVHADGKPVTGEVEIRYKEYRDAADIAFSKLPMTIHQGTEELAFNSAGMFEIYAYQDGEKLLLDPEKPMTVDYMVTEQLPDLYFWQLEEGEWKKLRPIGFAGNARQKKTDAGGRTGEQRFEPLARLMLSRTYGRKRIKSFHVETAQGKKIENWQFRRDVNDEFEFNCSPRTGYVFYSAGMHPLRIDSISCGYDSVVTINVQMQPVMKNTFWTRAIAHLASGSRKQRMAREGTVTVVSKMPQQVEGRIAWDDEGQQLINNTFSKLADAGAQKAGENYRKLVTGLSCPAFGVYNCDQTYSIANRIIVNGTYTDENGKEIDGSGLLSVITAGVNGAISYAPGQFACSADGTTLLLFSSDNQIYVLDRSKFREMNLSQNGDYTFRMHNATNEIRNSNDLRRYLNLPSR